MSATTKPHIPAKHVLVIGSILKETDRAILMQIDSWEFPNSSDDDYRDEASIFDVTADEDDDFLDTPPPPQCRKEWFPISQTKSKITSQTQDYLIITEWIAEQKGIFHE